MRFVREFRTIAPAFAVAAGLACATGAGLQTGETAGPVPTVRGGEKLYASTGPAGQLERVFDPEFHMAQARRQFDAGLERTASDEIEKVAAFVDYEAHRSAGDKRDALEALADDLQELANRVARGDVETRAPIDTAFARTRNVLRR